MRSDDESTREQPSNPYESPRTDPSPTQRTARRLGVWLAAPLSLVAALIAFCGACYPTAFVAFGMAYGVSYESSPWSWLAYPLMALPWLLGVAAAYIVGRAVWRIR